MQIYDQYAKAMFQTAFNFCKDDQVAQDVMQDAFIKAFKKIETYNGEASFGAWLKRIVINQSLDYLKKRKIETVELQESIYQIPLDANEEDEQLQKLKMVYQAIELLPSKCKNVTKLFLIEGYNHEEIAQILDITEIASRSLLSRGRSKLKELLTKQVS